MPFDTAVFYDIENLLQGYASPGKIAANLSLKSLLIEARATTLLGDIAVQRAYANWSDPRLGVMRDEIASMGIDPIQVFGFNREHKKNAADIQLAVDAIDLSYLRPAITVFVIVSGDGGFSALAKKLHEHGKTVVGCAYEHATNRVFRSVCDAFVSIADPECDVEEPGIDGKQPEIKKGKPKAATAAPRVVAAKLKAKTAAPAAKTTVARKKVKATPAPTRKVDPTALILEKLPRLRTGSSDEMIINHIRSALSRIAIDDDCRGVLVRGGLHIPNVQRMIEQLVPGFAPRQFGYRRVREFLQFAATGTELCVAQKTGANPMMMLRSAVPAGWSDLPDLSPRAPDSEIIYS